MPKNKNSNRRPQTAKVVRGRSLETRAMLLRGGDGPHGNPAAYSRKVKHAGRTSWDD
jgi:hypothetical protein